MRAWSLLASRTAPATALSMAAGVAVAGAAGVKGSRGAPVGVAAVSWAAVVSMTPQQIC
jgi:hypothetical protein